MRTGAEQEKLKSIAVHTVNEQPVGPDVALPEADIISGESVVTVPVRQSLPGDLPEAMRRDCALLDCELLKATLESLH